jgi:diguanylate cyclase (GGDEF)-like protein
MTAMNAMTDIIGAGVAIIADDEDTGRVLLSESVAEAGLQSLAYANGTDALAGALSNDVAIVLLDVDMPGLNGYEVCRRLRAEARFATIPIVMVTGHEDSEAIRLAFEAGATDFVAKPVNWSLLPRRLEYILRNAAAARALNERIVEVKALMVERLADAQRIERLAYFDPLTGLPNRQRCMESAESMFARAARSKESVAAIYIDLNSLKRVNDSFGHAMGDAVLRAFADRLVQTVDGLVVDPTRLMISRLGGDEFVVMMRGQAARTDAMAVAQKCAEAFKQAITHDALEFYSSPNIGVAVYPDDGADVATVLKHADTAMYHAKASSGPVVSYTPAMSARLRDWLELEGRLRRAVHNDLLSLVFQPKFRLQDNQLVGVEALLRWCDADYGDVSPTRFVEIAEDSGLILDMSSWVVRAVCRQMRKWLDRGICVPVAINCSGKELLHGDPARVVETEAAAAGVPTSLIEIELTESLLIQDSAAVQGALKRLRQLGCRIALDDFGTGYSSLAYITRFPPDRIKIDKAFVREVDRSPGSAAIANAILSLAQSLNLVVTAEGVERQDQLEWLRSRGCHEVQGFLLSKPLSAADFEARFFPSPESTSPEAAQCVSSLPMARLKA